MLNKEETWLLEEKYSGIATPEFEADCARLALGEPVAYVIGWQPFLGLKIYLDSRPLIPRTETEWWAEQLISALHERSGSHFGGVPQGDGPRPSDFSAEKYATSEFCCQFSVLRFMRRLGRHRLCSPVTIIKCRSLFW